ncbi:MAG: xanthine dehydrogenase accessory protein XdhC, partial [Comamonadaceae bacterium]
MADFTARLAHQVGVIVWVHAAQGSVPREAGTWMGVFSDAVVGTIGGGQLEFAAIAEARRRLAGGQGTALQRVALGPSLGQCCGGVVELRYELVTRADMPALQHWPRL